LIFSDLLVYFCLAVCLFYFCRRLWRSVFCPLFYPALRDLFLWFLAIYRLVFGWCFGCSIFATAFGGRFLPLFLSRFAGYMFLIFSSLMVCFLHFFVCSFVFPVPAVGGIFSPSFFSLSAILYF